MRTKTSRGPAYRVESERLVMRCWVPGDAAAVREAIDRSDAHLRPFIPFMKDEPRSPAETVRWVRQHRAAFDRDELYRYAVFDRDERVLIGEMMLLDRHQTGEREVGYWIDVNQCGRGFATEGTAAMTRLAFELDGVDRVDLHCDPRNRGSAGVARKLGFIHEATLQRRFTDNDGVLRDTMIWAMFREGFAASPAAAVAVTAFDCLGARLL